MGQASGWDGRPARLVRRVGNGPINRHQRDPARTRARPEQSVASALPGIWTGWADKAAIAPILQYLYTKRSAIDILLGGAWVQVDATDQELGVNLSQQTTHLTAMRAQVEDEIVRDERHAQANRQPVTGPILKDTKEGPEHACPRNPHR